MSPRAKRRDAEGAANRAQPGLFVAAALGAVGTLLALAAFRTPVMLSERVTDQRVELRTTYVQRITPVPSALYPEPEPLENEPFFFTRLVDELAIDVQAVVTAAPATAIEGTATLLVKVVAPERWSRVFVVLDERPLQSAGAITSMTVFDETVVLPMDEYHAFIAAVEDETRVAPREDYQIVVEPVIDVTADGDSGTVSRKFEMPFTFRLAGNTLYADGPYEQTLSEIRTHDVTFPGFVQLLGRDWPVMPVRVVALALIAPCLWAIAANVWRRLQEAAAMPETERLLRRHRGRLIEANSEPLGVHGSAISLRSFTDLLRVADQLDQPILVVRQTDEIRFAVADREIIYTFRPTAVDRTFPSRRAAGAMRPDHPRP